MLQRVASMVSGLFVTKNVVPPLPAPAKIVAPVPAPVVEPLDPMVQMIRGYLSEGFEKVAETPDGGVILRTPDDRVQVSLHPDGRITTSFKSLEPSLVH